MQQQLAEVIRECFPGTEVDHISAAPGGDIHRSFTVDLRSSGDHPARVFVKTNTLDNAAILQSEFESLRAFAVHTRLNYPRPIHFKHGQQAAFLVMEYRSIKPVDHTTAAQLGAMLAQQHQLLNANYGWPQQNFIGLTPQYNQWDSNWATFFRHNRLQPQLRFARANGMQERLRRGIEDVCADLHRLLRGGQLKPVLLHGDLWTGNAGFDTGNGLPVLYDPAPYYGAAEADLAMTQLFGSFPPSFYEAYHKHHPQQPGYPLRRAVYNLYHALNHFNLFGSGYANLVESQLQTINSTRLAR